MAAAVLISGGTYATSIYLIGWQGAAWLIGLHCFFSSILMGVWYVLDKKTTR
jgi:hypothetical protein